MKDLFSLDLLTAQPVSRKLLEKDVQKACVAYARSKKFWARKFSSPSQRSVPDYLFGKHYDAVDLKWGEEFKAPGKHSTEAQTEEQDLMAAVGWIVVRDTGTNGQADIDAFKQRIDEYERLYGGSK